MAEEIPYRTTGFSRAFQPAGHAHVLQNMFDYGMDIQGEGILIGKDSRGQNMIYQDKELMDDINTYLAPGVFLHLIIDTCFSGGLVNLWEFENRLSKNVILYSAANSEIVGWGGKVGGYLSRYFAMYAKPGRYAFQIADDILQRIEYMDQDDFPEAISPQIKYQGLMNSQN